MGLPRSGKSTVAKTMGYPIVNPDAIRLAVYGQRFWAAGEKLVWANADIMVKALFGAGHDKVVLDATNLTRWQRDQWQSKDWETIIHPIHTPPDVCKQRAIDTCQPDLVEVIDMMLEKFEPLEEDESRTFDFGLDDFNLEEK